MSRTSHIEKLTAAQEARFGEFVERWTAIGLCTEPADRQRAERAIHESYRLVGLPAPESIVWCGSPLGQALTRALVLHDSVWDSVWDSVRDSVRDSVGDSVRASVRASVGDSVWDSAYGQHDAPWLSFYAFFREACGLRQQTDRLIGLFEWCESAGWGIPHEHICWISERHNVCRLDDRQRIHCGDGPAISYPDGWSIWAHHGVRVPQRVIENPATLTAEEILAESKAEIRRVMIERRGPEHFLRDAAADPFQQDDYGRLWRIELAGDEPLVMVELENSTLEPDGTARRYWLRVPPDMDTALNAVAWTFATDPGDYVVVAAS